MDTQEMYERGVADAERGELHPFYYQHYYHYRRGYDKTRRRLRRPHLWDGERGSRVRLLLAVAVVLAAGLGAFALLRSRAQRTAAAPTPIASAIASGFTATPARSPILPTATPPPPPATLHVGGMALISNTEGRVLRGRAEPGLRGPPRVAFGEGEQVRILDGPVDADGYTWWRIEGQSGVGWSAQQSPEGVIWLQPIDG